VACTSSIGWRGYCKVGGATLPFLNASVTHSQEIITSEPLSVDRYANYRSIHNYSFGKKIVNANLTTEVWDSVIYKTAFNKMLLLATGATGSCNAFGSSVGQLEICPNGGTSLLIPGGTGKAVVSGFSLRGNPGGTVQASFTIVSTNYTKAFPTSASLVFEDEDGQDDTNNFSPLPYYNSTFALSAISDDANLVSTNVTDWNLDVSCDVKPVYGFCHQKSPFDLRLGVIRVTGSFNYYSPSGIFGILLNSNVNAVIDLQCATITLPRLLFKESDLTANDINAPVYRKINFIGVGTSNNSSVQVSTN
jgi:hypothetical protein